MSRTERERQADHPGACDWVVYASYSEPHVNPVQVRAATERGAFRVAEAEHPGQRWVSAVPADYIPELCRCWTCQGRKRVPVRGRWERCSACAGTGETNGRLRREAQP